MKKSWFFSLLCCFFSFNTEAGKCELSDDLGIRWHATSIYQLKALNTVLDSCKKNSKNPSSCLKKNIQCDHFVDSSSSTPLWKCKAIDANAKTFSGNILLQKDAAAFSAKGACRSKSKLPDSCYIDIFTCVNLHGRNL